MGLKIRHLIQNQGVLGVCRLLIGPAGKEIRGIVKIVSFKTTLFEFKNNVLIYKLSISTCKSFLETNL